LFDQAAGGAGFSPRAIDLLSKLIEPMRALLDCKSEGCDRACSACVLTPDLREYHDLIDRRAALEFLDLHLWRLLTPDAAEKFVPDASSVTLWPTSFWLARAQSWCGALFPTLRISCGDPFGRSYRLLSGSADPLR
jgi:hypothetical protein